MIYQLKNSRTGEAIPEFETTVEVKKTKTHLTFDFYCKNTQFYSADDKYNGPIYGGDVCEAFICTGEDIMKYYEIEVAPNNCQFLYKIVNHGGMNNNINTYPIPAEENFLTSSVEKIGNDYRVKFSVPLDKIGYDEKIGVRYNAYRIETEGGITDKNLLAINPTMCDKFHVPSCFIKLIED